MALSLVTGAPTVLVRGSAFERTGLSREAIDRALVMTPDEFRVERHVVSIGAIYDDHGLAVLVGAFGDAGLVQFDDFFEMSGNWPAWESPYVIPREV